MNTEFSIPGEITNAKSLEDFKKENHISTSKTTR